MKRLAAFALALALPAATAHASPLSFNFSLDLNGHHIAGDFDGSDLNVTGLESLHLGDLLDKFHLGGFRPFGGTLGLFGGHLGLGGGLLGQINPEATHARFEDRFTAVMADYDDGVANIENFYTSDEYSDVVDDMERLVDRYDFFVTGVERQIDHLDTFITSANDNLTFYEDLLADYQSRDDLSEKRLARIEDWITTIEDGIQLKIDVVTERQTNLSEDLPTYQAFQTDLTSYLDEIVAAAGTTGDASSASLAASPLRALAASANDANCATAEMVTSAVPEPATGALALLAAAAGALLNRRRGASRPLFTTLASAA